MVDEQSGISDEKPENTISVGDADAECAMKKILLVEDNELNRDMLSRRLMRRGYTVINAVNGREAIAAAEREHPALILMDMSLPDIDGWSVTAILKSCTSTCVIPIIALTAHAMEGDRKRALESGCDDYETKPVELQRLLEKIQRLSKTHHAPVRGVSEHDLQV